MPSPQESKQPSNEPAQKQSAQELSPRQLIEQAMQHTIMELMQLRRTLWLVCKQVGPVAVDEKECHPLWRLKATRLDTGKMHLQAIQLPDPTPEQIKALTEILNGSKSPLEEAMQQTELRDYPPAYLCLLLMPTLVQREDGYWVDAALVQKPSGLN